MATPYECFYTGKGGQPKHLTYQTQVQHDGTSFTLQKRSEIENVSFKMCKAKLAQIKFKSGFSKY